MPLMYMVVVKPSVCLMSMIYLYRSSIFNAMNFLLVFYNRMYTTQYTHATHVEGASSFDPFGPTDSIVIIISQVVCPSLLIEIQENKAYPLVYIM